MKAMHQTDTAVDYVPDNAGPEIWREVPGWPYAVSTHGRVMRTQGAAATHVGPIHKIHIQNDGRVRTNFCSGGREKNWDVAVLVAEVFLGPKDDREIRFCDGIKSHCWLRNLEYVKRGTANARTGAERRRANQMRAAIEAEIHAEAEIHSKQPHAKNLCAFPGCQRLCVRVRCHSHELVADMSEKRRALRHLSDAKRGNSSQRGYGTMWQKLRLIILARDPTCQLSIICDGTAKSTQVDHKVPVSLGGSYDPENLHGVCRKCHAIKTTMEKHGISQSRRSTQLAKRLIIRA
jgi:5-methylcytosine-specific restriction protein A